MKNLPKASFNFVNFKIVDFSLKEPHTISNDISVLFEPSGEFNISDKEFKLILNYKAKQDEDDFINAKMISFFEIPDANSLDEIPDFFYRNSIAIAYPYLRAFITNLTIQAGQKPIIMPLLNLSELEKPFRENTIQL
jgi:preprotein translocase subunit SecB